MKKSTCTGMHFRSVGLAFFILAAAALVFAVSCGGKKTYKVGILDGLSFFSSTTDGFKEKMAELGYAEGGDIVYVLKKADISAPTGMEDCRTIVLDFLNNEKVDLIFAFPTEAATEAKKALAGSNVPLVFAHAGVEDIDLIKSIREPGGNLTGVRFPGPEISLRRFEALMQVKPGIKKVFAPYLKGYPSVPAQLEQVRKAASAAGVEIEDKPFSSPPELIGFLNQRDAQRTIDMDAIMGFAEPLTSTPVFMEPLFKFAAKRKIPIADVEADFGGAASVIGVMIDTPAAGKSAAVLADKVLKGTPAGTIPVITPENQITVNLAMAQRIGLTVPEGLLKQAVKVIK